MFQKLKRHIKYRLYSPALYAVDIALTNLKKVSVSGHRKPQAIQSNKLLRALIVIDGDSYANQMQFAPFFVYRKALRLRFGFVFKQMLLEDALRHTNAIRGFDLIFVKLLFTRQDAQAQKIIKHIHAAKGQAKLIYFDGDDDVCIQWPDIFPYLDLYVKKHVFSDLDQYGRTFVGKSNLTDYVASRWGVSFADNIIPNSKPLPPEQRDKLFLGYNLVLDDNISRELYFANLAPESIVPKENDVVCRATVAPDTWIYHLRKDVTPKLQTLTPKYKVLMPIKRVPQKEYYREMLSSKICISPFGYGEICWRDFEAILCRCLLIKPDMAHIRTSPDIFVPNQSYVPVKWDFSDLNDKCAYYLEHDDERERIVEHAYRIVADYYRNDSFIELFADMLDRLDLVHL
jgi:hypothetical protein